MSFWAQVERFEANLILDGLILNKWKINQTAKEMGIPKKTLLRKIRKYGLRAYKPTVTSHAFA